MKSILAVSPKYKNLWTEFRQRQHDPGFPEWFREGTTVLDSVLHYKTQVLLLKMLICENI